MDPLPACPHENSLAIDENEQRVPYQKCSIPSEPHSMQAPPRALATELGTCSSLPAEFTSCTPVKYVHNQDDADADGEALNDTHKKHFVHRGTSMDTVGEKRPRCKYCMIRMAKLREMERKRPTRGTLSCSKRVSSGEASSSQVALSNGVDKSCQTSAALFDQAAMTEREIRMFMVVLRYRSGKPLSTETFCNCVQYGLEQNCTCGEEDKYFEWLWDPLNRGNAAHVLEEGRVVMFHKNYSCGTTAICGQQLMDKDQYFWEIKMTTPVYGTDMMVGVGTSAVDLNRFHNEFCSMLGRDSDSWGLSYDGRVQHSGRKRDYCGRFGQGAIIGVHLDMWHGTLTFFKNRRCLGVAFRGLRRRSLYPMVCSTAARSTMKVVSSRSFPSSLQYLCCRKLRKLVPPHLNVLDVVAMPPGLRSFLFNNLAWLLAVPHQSKPSLASAAATPSSSSSSLPSTHICSICLPLKNVFEGYTDDEGESSDDDHIHDGYNYLSSEDEDDSSGEEARKHWNPRKIMNRWRVLHSATASSSSELELGSPIDSSTSSLGSRPKRSRLDSTVSTSSGEEKANSEAEDSILEKEEAELSADRGNAVDEVATPRRWTLGKSKRSRR